MVHVAGQQVLEFKLGGHEVHETQIGVGRKADQEVVITIGAELAPCGRADEAELNDLVAPAEVSYVLGGQLGRQCGFSDDTHGNAMILRGHAGRRVRRPR